MAEKSGQNPADKKARFLLAVDSNPRNLFYTGMLLQKFGYAVYTMHTAKEALELMAVAVPTLVVTELVLPEMTGLEMITQIRQDPALRPYPSSFKQRWLIRRAKSDVCRRDARFTSKNPYR